MLRCPRHTPRTLAALLLTLALAGCTSSMTPGKMQWVRTDSNLSRAGNAYLLRGWIGIFSSGIDNLTTQINSAGVRAHVYQDDQWSSLAARLREQYKRDPNHEPLVLIGHSYGADDSIRIARALEQDHIPVDLLITLDPVTPPEIPTNVRRCINIYQSNGIWDAMPFLRGVPVKEESSTTTLANYNVRTDRKDLLEPDTDHFNIEKNQKIHSEILTDVLKTCPPRWQWLAMHREPAPLSAQDSNSAQTAGASMSSGGMTQAQHLSTSGRSVAIRRAPADRSSLSD